MDVNKTTKALEVLAKGKAWSVDSTKIYWQDSGSAPTQSQIDAEISKQDAAYIANEYQRNRQIGTATTTGYPLVNDQLDQLYHDINAGKFGGDAKTGAWFVGITSVKTAFPKP